MADRQKQRLHIRTPRDCYEAATAEAERAGKARTDIVIEAVAALCEELEAGTIKGETPEEMVRWQITAYPKTQRQLRQLGKKLGVSRSEVVTRSIERRCGRS